MVDLIKPSELPPATQAYSDSELIIDDAGAVKKATAKMIADAGAPVATEAQALAGSNNERRMTPLRVKRVLDNVAAPSVLRAQAWAESSTNPDPADPDSKSAKTWASLAEDDASSAASSKSAAAISASNASSSANSANNSANAAAASALAAYNSASSASNSASSALLSANNASNSAQDASDSALAASGSAFNAANSASNALSSANSATMSKDEAHDWAVAAQTAAGAVGGAPQSWGDFQAGVFTAFADGALASFNGVSFERDRSANIANLPTGPGWKIFGDITPLHFGADNTGIGDCTAAFGNWWAYLSSRVFQPYPSVMPVALDNLVIPRGIYLCQSSVNMTNLKAWNIFIDASGAVINSRSTGRASVDLTANRGVHIHGLTVISADDVTPSCGLLLGPELTITSGNNKFTDVKVLGTFSIAACLNVGSETTRYDMCYFMNRSGLGYAADGLNALGVTSEYTTLRPALTAVSFTNNLFTSCRIENGDQTGPYAGALYMEATGGWCIDKSNYILAFGGSNVVMVERNGIYRNGDLTLAGLFESNQGDGVDNVIHVKVGGVTAISMDLDCSSPHCKNSVIKVTAMDGVSPSTNLLNFRISRVRVNALPHGATKIFDGALISFNGTIECRDGSVINVASLESGYGTIYCDNTGLIPSTASNGKIAFDVLGQGTLSEQGLKMGGSAGSFVGIQGSRVRAMSSNANADLWLSGQGSGNIRFGTHSTTSDVAITGYITIKDDGGTARKIAIIS